MTSTVTAREYLRVSRDKSGRERSPQEQHDDNRRAADTRGWTLGPAYKDIGSASKFATKERDEFGRLVDDLKNGIFGANILVLWESSRGSRRVSEWVQLIELCEERRVQIYVTSDAKLYDPADARDRRSLLEDAVDAEYETAKTSKRARRAAAANAVAGRPTGRVPFGYKRTRDPETGRVDQQVPEPAEAAVVQELFRRLHGGDSLRGIARDFEARGIRTRTGIVFSAQHLRSLALTEGYAGVRVHVPGRRSRDDAAGRERREYAASWPGLVDRDLFEAVKHRLTDPSRVTTRPGRGVHLLSMIAVCDVCSGPLAARNSKEREPEYACHRGSHVRVGYDALNDFTASVIIEYLSRPGRVEKLLAQDDRAELQAARDKVAEIQAELDDLADQVGSGALSATLAARSEPRIIARLKAAQEREAALGTPNTLRGILSPGDEVAERWADMPMSAKREVARILLSPAVIGELRVTRAPSPGHTSPMEDRVVWGRESNIIDSGS